MGEKVSIASPRTEILPSEKCQSDLRGGRKGPLVRLEDY